MWIRSQNKYRLLNTNYIEIFERPNGESCIYVDDQKYAVYSTKEKALKVLDMIHSLIYDFQLSGVFQLPQDDEVEE
jgi:hypothetical protein